MAIFQDLGGEQTLRFNAPARVLFAGWETNTHALQRHGWELSVAEELRTRRMQLAMRHPGANLRMMSEQLDWDYFSQRRDAPVFVVRHVVGSSVTLNVLTDRLGVFSPIGDVQHVFKTDARNVDDLCWFRPPEQIIVDKKTVAYHMEQIAKLNEPELQRIASENRRRALMGDSDDTKLTHHAQILSIA